VLQPSPVKQLALFRENPLFKLNYESPTRKMDENFLPHLHENLLIYAGLFFVVFKKKTSLHHYVPKTFPRRERKIIELKR